MFALAEPPAHLWASFFWSVRIHLCRSYCSRKRSFGLEPPQNMWLHFNAAPRCFSSAYAPKAVYCHTTTALTRLE